ncbi:EAF domain-containing protein [Mycena indigotica]|uniref:EAF domain-containing protein n=1 Tax=Mycena indigotica TaxID=2126181 RepID=A0A8H6W375_9AGAR|nr:EAF domain-containing protein [Mycena indigotica]KAF7301261.1 EAF domain-containing protein [Mycena indigotica]
MASDDTSWIPQGTHNVVIGPSLHKHLKARRGVPAQPPKRVGPPERDFFTFRYNFKPTSVDITKPGTIEVNRNGKADGGSVRVEHPSAQPGESNVYLGTEIPSKEFDCVLIYDEETGDYKLEKLEACMNLSFDKRRQTESLPASSASTPAPPILDNEHPMELDAIGELDDDISQYHALRQEEEEDEEGELLPIPPVPVPPKPAAPKPPRKIAKKPPPPPPPLPAELDGDAYEEDLQFGKPTVKRRRKTPPPPPPPVPVPVVPDLSLPGSSSGWTAPPPPIAVPSDSEDPESDWEEAVPTGVVVPISTVDIDMNDLEAELEAELFDAGDGEDGSDDDFLANAMPNTFNSDPPIPKGVPLSLQQFAASQEGRWL